MNISTRTVNKNCIGSVRRFASVQKSKSKSHDLQKGQAGGVAGLLEQSKLPSGISILAIENNSPISKVGVLVRAGSRFENEKNFGATHALRIAAGLSTKTSTTFGITRNTDYVGASLTCSSTREDLFYVVEAKRDNIGLPVAFLSDTVTRHAFKPWELGDNAYRMKIDVKRMKHDPETRLMELLHKAAFSSGLSNSIYSPDFMIGEHDHDMLHKYVDEHFKTNRMAVVGLGVDLNLLTEVVQKSFDQNTGSPPEMVKPKFVAGNLRKQTAGNVAYVAVAAEGASARSSKEALSLSLFQQVLGSTPRVKYSEGKTLPLGAAAGQATQHPFALTTININYSDTGLFGFAVGAAGADIHNVVKSIVKKMREVGKGLTEDQLKNAKHQLLAGTLMSLENPNLLLEETAVQALNGGAVETGKLNSVIDSITLSDLREAAARVLKGKVAIASVGQVNNVPFIDDLV